MTAVTNPVDVPELVTALAPEVLDRARLATCRMAFDVEDARYLLDVLGLLPTPVQRNRTSVPSRRPWRTA